MAGQQLITSGTGWVEVSGATGSIILNNTSKTSSIQITQATTAPAGALFGVTLELEGNIKPDTPTGESLWARALNGDVLLAWIS